MNLIEVDLKDPTFYVGVVHAQDLPHPGDIVSYKLVIRDRKNTMTLYLTYNDLVTLKEILEVLYTRVELRGYPKDV